MNQPANNAGSNDDITTDLIEYFIIAVPDLASLDSLGPALAEVAQRATIRILDLVVVVVKDPDGSISVLEADTIDCMRAVKDLIGEDGGLLSERDIALASVALQPGSVGIVLVTEDRWAEPLSAAAQRAGGQIIAGERIPASKIESALAERLTGPNKESRSEHFPT